MALSPTSHYVVIFVKATTQRRPPSLDLCSFSLDMKGGIPVLAISHASAGPDALIDAITCGCVAQGKACSTQYSFYHHHSTCMLVCNCALNDMCCNPLNMRGEERWNWKRITRMSMTLDCENDLGSLKQSQKLIRTTLLKSKANNPTADLRDC